MIKLNGYKIKPTIFPDGTSQVWKIPEMNILNSFNIITWEFENEGEFLQVAQLCDLIDQECEGSYLTLDIPYLPYARQDKETSNNTTFAKRTFTNLLNSLGVDNISSMDVHSKLADQYGIENHEPTLEIEHTLLEANPTTLCFPDKGAKDRYLHIIKGFDLQICSFEKVRNQETGRIERLDLNELVNIKGEDVLIVDDICDGGMTFKLCAERLLTLGAKSVNLYTTHGIYSKGVETLRESGINRIFNRKGEVYDEINPTPPEGMLETEMSNIGKGE